MQKTILEIRNLSKNYHTKKREIPAINNLSFSVYENEILAIVGPSGCGKSTLLSILANLENKSSGKIIKNDNLKIGYMLQTDSLFPWLNVLDNTTIGLDINNINNNHTVDNAKKLLKKYGLADFIKSYPNNLSGGMRQRVALIRTLAVDPNLILLDEPFSALDYQTRLALSCDIYKIIKNEKKTAVLITHDIAEAISMADRVIVLTKRPCKVKNVYKINLDNKGTPMENRKNKLFNYYYDLIWRDLDVHI